MQGEVARGWNPEPQRAPLAPVMTRRVYSDGPDPGAASGPLPPFRPGSAGSPLADVHAAPVADVPLDTEPPSEPSPSAGDQEAASAEQAQHPTQSEPEEVLLLDEVVDADAAETELDALEPWRAPEAAAAVDTAEDLDLDKHSTSASDHTVAYGDEVEAGDAGAAHVVEPVAADEAGAVLEIESADADAVSAAAEAGAELTQELGEDEEPWDALGEALQQAVARANPPLAEDLVRSAEPSNHAEIEERHEIAPPPRTSFERCQAGEAGADSSAAEADTPSVATHTDGLSDDLAATLESLASKLRARGFNGLDEAFTRGGRLESSLALFLAGYRAGLDE